MVNGVRVFPRDLCCGVSACVCMCPWVCGASARVGRPLAQPAFFTPSTVTQTVGMLVRSVKPEVIVGRVAKIDPGCLLTLVRLAKNGLPLFVVCRGYVTDAGSSCTLCSVCCVVWCARNCVCNQNEALRATIARLSPDQTAAVLAALTSSVCVWAACSYRARGPWF